MKLRPLALLLISLACAAAGAARAGKVEVVFVDPASYTDIGATRWDEQANLREIDRHLRTLGQRFLPADQTLKVEVLGVDLAGALRPQANGTDLRVLSGQADFPRMRLRYVLAGNGVQRNGEERLADLNYARGLAKGGDSEALFYEKRMLNDWFKARFVDGRDD